MIIFWVLFGTFVLFLWLSGHWFGRVLATVILAGLVGMTALVADIPGAAIRNLTIGLPAAWIIGGVPIWIAKWRRQRGVAHPADVSFVIPYPRQ